MSGEFLGDVPRQELLGAVDRMPGDASEDKPQVGFRIEAVELGRADQAVDGRGALTARLSRAATVN